ncbi:MAG: hypothetical protein QOJ35_1306 [Solirubrobacteraceae bacterium]|jgi:hypothetical protein|nr:hypothetical protein [Solirubrobacteraceae bacterium]
MDWREFVASMVGSLAWPFGVVILVLILRGPLTAILGRGPLSSLKVGPMGAEAKWQEVRADVVAGSAPKRLSSPDGDVDLSDVDDLAEQSPAEAIEAAYVMLLAELRRIVGGKRPELLKDNPKAHVLLKSAYHDGVLSRENAEALRGMLTLRDLTVQRPETATTDRANDFIVMARAVLYALSRA